ncbi:basic salivary proline-rich protein 1-like [Dasypus novemcinctus]|uniref:basic salivary proline-rich protein 1-like n=1 Tax=Dasypus novemcinctus TaxID=9361 RepID=UPI0039C9E0D2
MAAAAHLIAPSSTSPSWPNPVSLCEETPEPVTPAACAQAPSSPAPQPTPRHSRLSREPGPGRGFPEPPFCSCELEATSPSGSPPRCPGWCDEHVITWLIVLTAQDARGPGRAAGGGWGLCLGSLGRLSPPGGRSTGSPVAGQRAEVQGAQQAREGAGVGTSRGPGGGRRPEHQALPRLRPWGPPRPSPRRRGPPCRGTRLDTLLAPPTRPAPPAPTAPPGPPPPEPGWASRGPPTALASSFSGSPLSCRSPHGRSLSCEVLGPGCGLGLGARLRVWPPEPPQSSPSLPRPCPLPLPFASPHPGPSAPDASSPPFPSPRAAHPAAQEHSVHADTCCAISGAGGPKAGPPPGGAAG